MPFPGPSGDWVRWPLSDLKSMSPSSQRPSRLMHYEVELGRSVCPAALVSQWLVLPSAFCLSFSAFTISSESMGETSIPLLCPQDLDSRPCPAGGENVVNTCLLSGGTLMIQSLQTMKFIGIVSRDDVPQNRPSLAQANLHVQSGSPSPLPPPRTRCPVSGELLRGRCVSRTV